MKIAIYPGSFDPVTLGHLSIIHRAAKLFDKLIVCVMVNFEKNPMFNAQERVELIKKVTADIPNVEVEHSAGLLADYVREKNACVVVKGLRAVSDFEKEFQMAIVNKKLNPALDTMFLTSDAEHMYLSSSVVREMAKYEQDLSCFLPECIIPEVEAKTKIWRKA